MAATSRSERAGRGRRHRLLIVGASGFGREILCWAREIPKAQREWDVGGFLDANPGALEGFGVDVPILGDPVSWEPEARDRFVCAIGDPTIKLRLCRALSARGAVFSTFIHPSAHVPAGNHLGEGVVFCPRSGLTTNVTVGDFVTFNLASGAGHDARIGDGCTFSGYAEVTGNVVLGEGVLLGSHACVLPGVAVGDFAKIGAGGVVVRRVPPGATVFGNPARQVAGFEA